MAIKAKGKDEKGFTSETDLYLRIDLESFNHSEGHAGIQVGGYADAASSKKNVAAEGEDEDLQPSSQQRIFLKLYPADKAQCAALRDMNIKQRYAWLKEQDADLAAGTEV